MSYEQKSCDSFRLCDFCVPFCQMKNQYIFRVIHIQSVHHASALMEKGAGDCGLEWGSRLFACHNCTIAFSKPLVNISELMWLPFMTAVMLPLPPPPLPLSLFKATLQPPPHSASTHPGSVWSFWIAANRWRHCGVSWRKKKKKMH